MVPAICPAFRALWPGPLGEHPQVVPHTVHLLAQKVTVAGPRPQELLQVLLQGEEPLSRFGHGIWRGRWRRLTGGVIAPQLRDRRGHLPRVFGGEFDGPAAGLNGAIADRG